MESQKRLIHNGDWDYILLLDACRFDVFENVYEDYLEGNLSKVKSSGPMTWEWAERTFDSYLDVVYISGNPWINSRQPMEGFEGYKHFKKVIDVWDFGWSDNLGTTPPEALNEAVKLVDDRAIVHYMQPHAPFIEKVRETTFTEKFLQCVQTLYSRFSNLFSQEGNNGSSLGNPMVQVQVNTKPKNIRREIGEWLVNNFGEIFVSKLRSTFGLPVGPTWDMLYRHGPEKLREVYKNNLRYVLERIVPLVEELNGKIVITADHGEYLGEKPGEDIGEMRKEVKSSKKYSSKLIKVPEEGLLCYGHPKFSNNPILRHVPWLEVEK